MHWIQSAAMQAGLKGAGFILLPPNCSIDVAWETTARTLGIASHEVCSSVASALRIPEANFAAASGPAVRLVPERVAKRFNVLPLREDDKRLVVATSDPFNLDCEQAIEFASGRRIVFELSSPRQIVDAIQRAYDGGQHAHSSQESEELVHSESGVQPLEPTHSRSETTLAELDRIVGDLRPMSPAQQDTCILVVDDDPIERLFVSELLRREGFRVIEAADGTAAFATLQSGEHCSLVLTDLQMNEMDGDELIRRVRNGGGRSAIPIVVFTGSDDGEREAELIEAGADDYIRKPVNGPRMLARIRGALRRAAA